MATPQRARRDSNRVPNLLGEANDASGSTVSIQADPITGRLLVNSTLSSGLSLPASDYIGATYPDTVTEIYAFKLGGSSGTLQATVTVVYTDSTKANLSSVTKS